MRVYPQPFILVNNQYNECNTGFMVFYDCIVTLYFHFNLDYHSFIYIKNNEASVHYDMYTLTTGTIAHVTSFLPMPSAKRWGIRGRSLHMSCVPFKIPVPPIIQPAIIKKAQGDEDSPCYLRGCLFFLSPIEQCFPQRSPIWK